MKQIFILKEPTGNIKTSSDIFNKIKKFNIDFTRENFIIFYLDTKHKLINSEILFKGGLNSCLIDPKTLFKNALLNDSNSLIIAHNHPTGDLNPSREDKEIYKDLKKIGDLLELRILDSIIFNEKEFYSLNDEVF
jgi:DNA repair protein RadC